MCYKRLLVYSFTLEIDVVKYLRGYVIFGNFTCELGYKGEQTISLLGNVCNSVTEQSQTDHLNQMYNAL